MVIEKQNINIGFSDNVVEKLVDTENNASYRRILCGFAWPFADRAGFAIVLGEDFEKDYSLQLSPRHLRILIEHESFDLEELYRACLRFQSIYLFKSVLGNYHNPLRDIWRKYEKNEKRLEIDPPCYFDEITLNLVAQLVKKNTASDRKTLHFGKSVLPGYLTTLIPKSIEKEKLECKPALAALGYVLSEMERVDPGGHQIPGAAIGSAQSQNDWMKA